MRDELTNQFKAWIRYVDCLFMICGFQSGLCFFHMLSLQFTTRRHRFETYQIHLVKTQHDSYQRPAFKVSLPSFSRPTCSRRWTCRRPLRLVTGARINGPPAVVRARLRHLPARPEKETGARRGCAGKLVGEDGNCILLVKLQREGIDRSGQLGKEPTHVLL